MTAVTSLAELTSTNDAISLSRRHVKGSGTGPSCFHGAWPGIWLYDYIFPVDQLEEDKLDIFHHAFFEALHLKLYTAPVPSAADPIQRDRMTHSRQQERLLGKSWT
ncbi:unnamed protein product [Parascedosporium putredinis]|uniref:Uncharacterized protein n=1 Tax=Parascedosporium putredinis TaxID=1442378 RepID=A0A9P1H9U9_9PEZI|nr:unnamed protein product [Parascedosporium putredinis]CAI8002054.1 unnamed protein product [Parascedosporium putredinis]